MVKVYQVQGLTWCGEGLSGTRTDLGVVKVYQIQGLTWCGEGLSGTRTDLVW